MTKSKVNWSDDALASHAARIIPSPRSKPELIATSSLLAVIASVDEFGGRVLKRIGGPSYKNLREYISMFCETPASLLEQAAGFDSQSVGAQAERPWGKHDRPDGVIVVSRGSRTWAALVEVKIGQDKLDAEQVAAYHKMARQLGLDAVVTISNEVGSAEGDPPSSALGGLRAADLRKIPVRHLQWRDLLGDAISLYRKDLEENIADPDQDWILGQWIQYVMDERSDVLIPASLGDGWNETLQLSKKRMLQSDSKPLRSVVDAWRDVSKEIAFQMRLRGVRLEPKLSRKEEDDPSLVRDRLIKAVMKEGTLSLSWRCPSPIDVLHCSVELDSKVVQYFFSVSDFTGKSAGARMMSWVSQLDRKAADGVIIRPQWRKPSIETPLLLSQCAGAHDLNSYLREKGISTSDAVPSWMQIEWHLTLEGRSGRKGQEHLRQLLRGVQDFYTCVIAGLRSVEAMPVPPKADVAQRATLPTGGAGGQASPSQQ
jgi:hypothetical protein